MNSTEQVHTQIDAEVKERATIVLEKMGLSIEDAVRILLTRVADEGTLPPGFLADPMLYDCWFRAEIQAALDDPSPGIPASQVEEHFAARRHFSSKRRNEHC